MRVDSAPCGARGLPARRADLQRRRATGHDRHALNRILARAEDLHKNPPVAYHLVPAVDYLQANRMRLLLMQEFARAIQNVDVILGGRATLDSRTSLTPLTSMTGQPAIALPTGFTSRGIPSGVTLVGRLYDEATLLDAARVLESAHGLQGRRPAIDERPVTRVTIGTRNPLDSTCHLGFPSGAESY